MGRMTVKIEKRLLALIFCTTLIFIGAPAMATVPFASWYSQAFTSSGTWPPPPDVTTVDVLLVGGGGGGGRSSVADKCAGKGRSDRHHRYRRCRGVRLRSWQ